MRVFFLLTLFLGYQLAFGVQSPAGFYYTVKPGDCLSKILEPHVKEGHLYGEKGAVAQVARMNKHLKAYGNLIYPGQKVFIPKKYGRVSIKKSPLLAYANPEVIEVNEKKKKVRVPVTVTQGGETLNFVFDFNINLNHNMPQVQVEKPVEKRDQEREVEKERDDIYVERTSVKKERFYERKPALFKSEKTGEGLSIFGELELINHYSHMQAEKSNGGSAQLGSKPSYGVRGLGGVNIAHQWKLAVYGKVQSLQFKKPENTDFKEEQTFFWSLGGEVRFQRKKSYYLFGRGLFESSNYLTSQNGDLYLSSGHQVTLVGGLWTRLYRRYLSSEVSAFYFLPTTIDGESIDAAYGLEGLLKVRWSQRSDFGLLAQGRYKTGETDASSQTEIEYGVGVFFDW